MKIIVKIVEITLFLLVLTVYAGCNDNRSDAFPEFLLEPEVELNQYYYADQTVGKSITFTSPGAWTSLIFENTSANSVLEEAVSWLSITPDKGDIADEYTISLSLLPNVTASERNANIIIASNGTQISISVTQKATKADGAEDNEDKLCDVTMSGNKNMCVGVPVTFDFDNKPVGATTIWILPASATELSKSDNHVTFVVNYASVDTVSAILNIDGYHCIISRAFEAIIFNFSIVGPTRNSIGGGPHIYTATPATTNSCVFNGQYEWTINDEHVGITDKISINPGSVGALTNYTLKALAKTNGDAIISSASITIALHSDFYVIN